MRTLCVEAKSEIYPKVESFVEDFLSDAPFTPKDRIWIHLCVEELFGVYTQYAADQGTNDLRISLDYKPSTDVAVMRFEDRGKPWKPMHMKSGKDGIGDSLLEKSLLIIRHSADNIRYEYKNGTNILTARRRIGREGDR